MSKSLPFSGINEKIFSFKNKFDKKLPDPVWETVSVKLKKYLPFLNINVFHFKKILRDKKMIKSYYIAQAEFAVKKQVHILSIMDLKMSTS